MINLVIFLFTKFIKLANKKMILNQNKKREIVKHIFDKNSKFII